MVLQLELQRLAQVHSELSSPAGNDATDIVAFGEDMARSRAACSDEAEVVRFGATSSNGADVVCSGAVTSQHILYYCTYYYVSFTCTVHCT